MQANIRSQNLRQLLTFLKEFDSENMDLKTLSKKIMQRGLSKRTAYDYAHAIETIKSLKAKPNANVEKIQPNPNVENPLWSLEWLEEENENKIIAMINTMVYSVFNPKLTKSEKKTNIDVCVYEIRSLLFSLIEAEV